jgi:protein-tyrosine phosphatase
MKKKNMSSRCVVCKAHSSALLVCGKCSAVCYCSTRCAMKDWKDFHAIEHVGKKQKNEDEGPTAHLVLTSIWLGGIEALSDENVMKHVDAVVSAVHEERVTDEMLDKLIGSSRVRIRVSIWDDPDEPIEEHFEEVAEFIHKQRLAGKRVLIHCMAGISRSVTLLIYYMWRYEGFKSAKDALEKIRETRTFVEPNKGFWKKLLKWTGSEKR